MGVGGQLHDPADLPRERGPVPTVQEAGWAPGRACRVTENLATIGTRTPGSPARSESLYRLRYAIFVSVHNVQQKYDNNRKKN
jgi:hypothetical protein